MMEGAGNLTVMDILAGGVDFELAGNGGPDCLYHVPISLRSLEVAVSVVLIVLSLLLGQKFDQGRSEVCVYELDNLNLYKYTVPTGWQVITE